MPNSLQLTQEEVKELVELEVGDSSNGMEVVDTSNWTADGKYQYQKIVFKRDDKFWLLAHWRTGSPYSDYYYQVREGDHNGYCAEVEQVEEVVKRWAFKI